MSKWDRVQSSFERGHDDLFDDRYSADFYNYAQGSYDPDTGEMDSGTRSSLGTENVEIVPPAQDSTVDLEGTSFSWSTSIRFPIGQGTLTVKDGDTYTLEVGETEKYALVEVNAGGTLVVNGRLVTGTLTVDGTLDNNGIVIVLSSSTTNEFVDSFHPLGDDSYRPTEVEVKDNITGEITVYELHSYTEERGSGMIMCRLVEQ